MVKENEEKALNQSFRAFKVNSVSRPEVQYVNYVKLLRLSRNENFPLLQRELENSITNMDITAQEAIDELEAIHMEEVKLGDTTIQNIPIPIETGREILKNLLSELPR